MSNIKLPSVCVHSGSILVSDGLGNLYWKEPDILDIRKSCELIDLKRYPKKCPDCTKPAYVGLNNIICSNKDCKNYKEENK